jgi:hypothetical protein
MHARGGKAAFYVGHKVHSLQCFQADLFKEVNVRSMNAWQFIGEVQLQLAVMLVVRAG